MISVYDIGNTNYTGNGNAVLQPKECKLRNIAGGNYDLTMNHPIDPEGKWKHLVPGAIIKAPVPREEIENAYAGYAADVYKTTAQAELRESASEPTSISYNAWNWQTDYQIGSKVSVSGQSHKNYQCTYFDPGSGQRQVPPYNSSWWKPIPDKTSGAPVLVTLPAGTDLYFVEDYDTNWYKMSTYYGVVGYIKKDKVTYDRHLTPSETQPRIITEQLFRIEKPTVDTKSRTVTVTAKHVSYDLAGILVQDVSIAQATPAMALGRIVEGFMMEYQGTIATDMQTDEHGTYTGDIKGKNGIYALLDPDSGIVSSFNAAYKRDNWDLFVLTRNDVDRGYRLKYRKNMLGVNMASDSSGLVTRVVPVAKNETGADLYLPERWIDSSRIGDYPVVKMEQLTVKGQVGKDKGTGDGSIWTESDLLAEMREKAGERFSVDHADMAKVTVTVDFEQQGDAEEHRELKGLETVLLYDTVTVENEEIGLGEQLYVCEWEWDAIRRKITALKLVNTTDYQKGSVTGYNVQNKSISSEKLMDEARDEIIEQVVSFIPEYADPDASRPATVTVVDSDPTLAWGTRSKVGSVQGTDLHVTMPGNPAPAVINNLSSTSATDALSANQGRVLNSNIAPYNLGSISSMADLKTAITNYVATQPGQSVRYIQFYPNFTDASAGFSPAAYGERIGEINIRSEGRFSCLITFQNGTTTLMANDNGTWIVDTFALNSKITSINLKNTPLYEGIANANGTFNLTGGNMDDYTYLFVYVGSGGIRGSMYIPVSLFKIKPIYLPFIYGGTMREIDIQYVSGTQIKVTSNPGLNEVFEIFGCNIQSS